MTCCLMFRDDPNTASSRFYRVEICANLFQEFSVLREWGYVGSKGRQMIGLFPDLLTASKAADKFQKTKLQCGYQRINVDLGNI